MPLSEDSDGFTYNIYDRCNEATKITDLESRQQRLEDIGWDMNQLQHQVNQGSVDFYRDLLEDLEGLWKPSKMSGLLDENVDFNMPAQQCHQKGAGRGSGCGQIINQDKFPKAIEAPAAKADDQCGR